MERDDAKIQLLASKAIDAIVADTENEDERRFAARRVAEHFGLLPTSDEELAEVLNDLGIEAAQGAPNPVVKRWTYRTRFAGRYQIWEYEDGTFRVAIEGFSRASLPLSTFQEARAWIPVPVEEMGNSDLGSD